MTSELSLEDFSIVMSLVILHVVSDNGSVQGMNWYVHVLNNRSSLLGELLDHLGHGLGCTMSGSLAYDTLCKIEAKVSQNNFNCEDFIDELKGSFDAPTFHCSERIYAELESLSLSIGLGEVLDQIR